MNDMTDSGYFSNYDHGKPKSCDRCIEGPYDRINDRSQYTR